MRTILTAAVFAVALAGGCETKKKSKPTTKTTEPDRSSAGSSGGGGGGSSSGGSGGAAQAVRAAPQRTVTQNDLTQIRTFIEYASGSTGQMPAYNDTYAAIKKEAPAIAKKIDDGWIVLNNARSREEIWAYEADAVNNGGWVCSSNGVERMDAQTLKQRLGK